MNSKERQKQFSLLLAGGVAVAMFMGQLRSLERTVDRLSDQVDNQRDRIHYLERELDQLKLQNQVVKESSYHLREFSSVDTEVVYEIYLRLGMDFQVTLTLYYRPLETEDWQSVQMDMSLGEARLNHSFDSSKDYDLKIGYIENNTEQYESLPLLDLYSKEDSSWASSIQTTRLKGNKLDYNLQIARWRNAYEADLEGATCKVYYDDKLVDEFEVLERMAAEKQSLPNAILESEEGQHWFVKRQLVIENVKDIQPEKLLYEVEIHSRGNVFKRIYDN